MSDARTDAATNYDPSLITVPFVVDDQYISSGCMGDCTTAVTQVDGDCPERAVEGAQGQCHHFVYSLSPGSLTKGWAGIMWQTNEQNWGSAPGRHVAPGATHLHFFARGAAGGEKLTFIVGGMDGKDAGTACGNDLPYICASGVCAQNACTEPHHDVLKKTLQDVVLTAGFTAIDIPFDGASYGNEVLSGFAWIATMPSGTQSVDFYLDDIRWE